MPQTDFTKAFPRKVDETQGGIRWTEIYDHGVTRTGFIPWSEVPENWFDQETYPVVGAVDRRGEIEADGWETVYSSDFVKELQAKTRRLLARLHNLGRQFEQDRVDGKLCSGLTKDPTDWEPER